MNKKLLLLLIAQVLLLLTLQLTERKSPKDFGKPLLTIADISEITLTAGKDKTSTKLVAKDGTWEVAGEINSPANKSKLDNLLQSLQGIKKGLIVGKTDVALKKLKVTETTYEVLATIGNGKDTQTLLLGTSPTFRQVHVRDAKSPEVYVANFPATDITTNPYDWIDRSVFALPKDKLSSVELGSTKVEVDATGKLAVPGLDKPDIAKARELITAVTTLRYDAPAGKTEVSNLPLVLTITASYSDSTTASLRLRGPSKSSDYFVENDAKTFAGLIAKDKAEGLIEFANLATLKIKSATAEVAAPVGPDAMSPLQELPE